ncbi:hypothetical protein PCASD_00152 [Puccinia coronata f. sp. avenae]|uniref:Uncharacterized protein n=1 Tax=Puccinia coronata f. sp. avenae TaxID=200324 RepID=A0A2N5VQU5_9BASI|nr:hypothetical protein PCASD_00152 [Puccinia coronata f. sp. avenae]
MSLSSSMGLLTRINFLFYLPVPADPPAASAQKRCQPQNAPPPPPKRRKFQLESDKIVIDWPASSKNFEEFKTQVIQAIMEKEDKLFAVTVPNDHTFAANHKQQLESDATFELFVTVSSKVADSHKILCCLFQKDPRVIAERESAYSQLRVAHGKTLPPQEQPPPETTEGAALAEAHCKLIKQLFAATNPCEQLTSSHELHVFVNPKNNNEYFPLTMARANA